jgi:hypothetical protein
MRLILSTALLASTISTGSAFAVSGKRWGQGTGVRMSTIEAEATGTEAAVTRNDDPVAQPLSVEVDEIFRSDPADIDITSAGVKSRLDAQLAELRKKDATSLRLKKEVSRATLITIQGCQSGLGEARFSCSFMSRQLSR